MQDASVSCVEVFTRGVTEGGPSPVANCCVWRLRMKRGKRTRRYLEVFVAVSQTRDGRWAHVGMHYGRGMLM
jgi:hypothetical protein